MKLNYLKRIGTSLLLLIITIGAYGQGSRLVVKGKVVTENQEPIIGATILEKIPKTGRYLMWMGIFRWP